MATAKKIAKPGATKPIKATATKAPATKAPATKAPAAKTPATKTAAKPAPAPKVAASIKPVKETLTKTSLATLVAEQSGVEAKSVKAVLSTLEAIILGSVHKKGAGEFTLPGLLKIGVQKVPAKPKRKGIDPFTKLERVFAAKPATVKIKARALKKLKDAAL